MTRPPCHSESIELIERARSHALWARRHLLAYDTDGHPRADLVRAKRLLAAASEALGTAAMDSTLPTNVTKALVDSWAGLDAFLVAAGDLDEDSTGTDARQFLTRAATFLVAALPTPEAPIRVGAG
jgi:hypothetical protein